MSIASWFDRARCFYKRPENVRSGALEGRPNGVRAEKEVGGGAIHVCCRESDGRSWSRVVYTEMFVTTVCSLARFILSLQ